MFNKLWNRIKKFWKWLVFGGAAVAIAAIVALPPEEIPTLTIDEKSVEFSYTDDNSGEDLIIRTNQENYLNLFGNFTLYFSVTNKSGQDQQIKAVFSFNDSGQKKYVNTIQEYDGETAILIPTSTIPAATSTEEQIIPAYQKTKTIWADKAISKKIISPSISRKNIKSAIEGKGNDFLLKAGETKFFKANIKYIDFNNREEFFIEAFGDQGGYGHLDPWTFEDKFNSDTKTTGDLTGQDGWSGSVEYDVVTTQKFEGDQSVYVAAASVSISTTGLAISGTDQTVYFAMRSAVVGNAGTRAITIVEDTLNATAWAAGFYSDGTNLNLSFFKTGGWVQSAAVSLNTWYVIRVDYNGTTKEVRFWYKQTGGTWTKYTEGATEWFGEAEATNGGVDELRFSTGAGAWAMFYDTITPTDPEPDPSPSAETVPQQVIIFD